MAGQAVDGGADGWYQLAGRDANGAGAFRHQHISRHPVQPDRAQRRLPCRPTLRQQAAAKPRQYVAGSRRCKRRITGGVDDDCAVLRRDYRARSFQHHHRVQRRSKFARRRGPVFLHIRRAATEQARGLQRMRRD